MSDSDFASSRTTSPKFLPENHSYGSGHRDCQEFLRCSTSIGVRCDHSSFTQINGGGWSCGERCKSSATLMEDVSWLKPSPKCRSKPRKRGPRRTAHGGRSKICAARVDRVFDDFRRRHVALAVRTFTLRHPAVAAAKPSWSAAPAVDVTETEKAYEITAELPAWTRKTSR